MQEMCTDYVKKFKNSRYKRSYIDAEIDAVKTTT